MKFFEDKVNGKSKGYALVEYYSPEAAHQAKEKLQGKYVEIMLSFKCFGCPKSVVSTHNFVCSSLVISLSRVNISSTVC